MCFGWVLKGRSNRIDPKKIAAIKLTAKTWAGWNFLSPLIFLLLNGKQFEMIHLFFSIYYLSNPLSND